MSESIDSTTCLQIPAWSTKGAGRALTLRWRATNMSNRRPWIASRNLRAWICLHWYTSIMYPISYPPALYHKDQNRRLEYHLHRRAPQTKATIPVSIDEICRRLGWVSRARWFVEFSVRRKWCVEVKEREAWGLLWIYLLRSAANLFKTQNEICWQRSDTILFVPKSSVAIHAAVLKIDTSCTVGVYNDL